MRLIFEPAIIGALLGLVLWLIVASKRRPARFARYHVGWNNYFEDQRRVIVGGRRYYVRRRADFAVIRFLRRLSLLHIRLPSGSKMPSLFAFRDDFRRIMTDRPFAGLIWCLTQRDRGSLKGRQTERLALWLLAQCEEVRALPTMVQFAKEPDRAVRKEATRALRRLKAWPELREIYESEQDPVIRQLAHPSAEPTSADRLAHVARHARSKAAWLNPAGRRATTLEIRETLDGGRRPKSTEYIRAIVWRVRRLVNG